MFQILNRTNNIFELVTVEPVLTERPSDRKKDIVLLSDESDGLPDDKKLRLKGTYKSGCEQMSDDDVVVLLELHMLQTMGRVLFQLN